jgi:WD40 repeat protein
MPRQGDSSEHGSKPTRVQTRPELQTLTGHKDKVRSVAVLLDGRRALSGSDDDTLRLWDLEAGVERHRFAGHTDRVNSVAVFPDGRRALSGSHDKTVRLWDLEAGVELRKFEGHTGVVRSVAAFPDGRGALSGSDDYTARIWDIDNVGAAGVGYTTARIALLGDSGVGKTGLGWRIAHDDFREHASTPRPAILGC